MFIDEINKRCEYPDIEALTVAETQKYKEKRLILLENECLTDSNCTITESDDQDENLKRKQPLIQIVKKSDLDQALTYVDKYPLLKFRKFFKIWRVRISYFCNNIISQPIFEYITITVILVNSIVLAIDDPTQETSAMFNVLDQVFLSLYSLEMILKILGLGLILNKGSYLRDYWNILDFTIVVSGYVSIFQTSAINFSSLRSFRVLRPLRTISNIEGLKIIVQALLLAFPLLRDTIIVLLVFCMIYAIGGLQLMAGTLQKRCVDINTGVIHEDLFCGVMKCENETQFCGKSMENPNYGQSNFDNVFYALLIIIQTITLEGWSEIMVVLQQTYSFYVFLFFIPLIFIGAFFLMNLTLAVINTKFTDAHKAKARQQMIQKKLIQKHGKHILKQRKNNKLRQEQEKLTKKRFMLGKIAASKMINFLQQKRKEKLIAQALSKRILNCKEKNDKNQENNGSSSSFITQSEDFQHLEQKSQQQQKNETTKTRNIKKLDLSKVKREEVEYSIKRYGPDSIQKICLSQRKIDNLHPKPDITIRQSHISQDVKKFKSNISHFQNMASLRQQLQEFDLDKYLDNSISQIPVSEHSIENNLNNIMKQGERKQSQYSDISLKSQKQNNQAKDSIKLYRDSFSSILSSLSNCNVEVKQQLKLKKSKIKQNLKAQIDIANSKDVFKRQIFKSSSIVDYVDRQASQPLSQQIVNEKTEITNDVRKLQEPSLYDQILNQNYDSLQESSQISLSNQQQQSSMLIDNKVMREIAKSPCQQTNSAFKVEDMFQLAIQENRKNITTEEEEKQRVENIIRDAEMKRRQILVGYDFSSQRIEINPDAKVVSQSYNDVFENRFKKENKIEESVIAISPRDFDENFNYYKIKTYYQPKENQKIQDPSIMNLMNKYNVSLEPYEEEFISVYKRLNKWENHIQHITRKSKTITSGSFSIITHPKNIKCLKKTRKITENKKNIIHEAIIAYFKKEFQVQDDKSFSFQSKQSVIEPVGRQKSDEKPKILTQRSLKLRRKYKKRRSLRQVSELKHYSPIKGDLQSLMTLAQKKSNKVADMTSPPMSQSLINRGNTIESTFFKTRKLTFKNKKINNEMHESFQQSFNKDEIFKIDIKSEDKVDSLHSEEEDWVTATQKITKGQGPNIKGEWSGQDVIEKMNKSKAERDIKYLNKIRIFPSGLYGIWKRFRAKIKRFQRSILFENFMTFCVTLNTLALALDNYRLSPNESEILTQINNTFTAIFIIELFIKLISQGFKRYLSDKMNYLDALIVVLSIVETGFFTRNKSSLSAFRIVRVFRTFRVLRVARLLRLFQSMQTILRVIYRSLSSFAYIALLLLLFIFIYALLGMSLYGGKFNFEDGLPRSNYDSIHNAFITTFQLLTLENWNAIMYDMLRSSANKIISAIYMLSWIFIGNFILLNLLLAVLLDSFSEEQEEEEDRENEIENENQNRQKQEKNKSEQSTKKSIFLRSQQNKIKSFQDILQESIRKKKQQEEEEKEEIIDEMDEHDLQSFIVKYGIINKKKIQFLYEDIECEESLYLFKKYNPIRLFAYKIVTHNNFEKIIIVLIILSSAKLIVDASTIDMELSDTAIRLSNLFDFIFTIIFTLESLLKSIAFGFVMNKNSYLREYWNILDFFIVMTSLLDITLTNIELPFIKILRLLRTLRPLRFISHNEAMKTIVIALLQSISYLINVVIVVIIVWIMFAILGVSLFGGKSFFCSLNKYVHGNESQCLQAGGEWKRYYNNFDDVIQAMMTLFVVSSFDNWPQIMNQAVDASSVDEVTLMNLMKQGPIQNNQPIAAYYFVLFILVGSFFFLNFFIGVLFLNFRIAQKSIAGGKNIHLINIDFNEEEINWLDMQKMICDSVPDFDCIDVPKNKFRNIVHQIVTSNIFDIFIMVCIILNMVQMALQYDGAPAQYLRVLEISNYVFTIIFFMEALLKIIALGKRYIEPTWNKFDAFVVLASIIDILLIIFNTSKISKFLRIGPQLARVLRVLRISRLLRIINKSKGLQALIQTITFSLPSLLNVLSLLLLVFFIYSVLGVYLFHQILEGEVIDNEYKNFKNFLNAMLFLLRIATGEDWATVMKDLGQSGNGLVTKLYFVSFILICAQVMINLFVLVILQQFNQYYLPAENVMSKFKDNLELFKITWKQFSVPYGGKKISEQDLIQFYKSMDAPLGLINCTNNVINKEIIQMGIRSSNGWIYFNELLYRSMRRIYGLKKLNSDKMKVAEFNTLLKIHILNLKGENILNFFSKKEQLIKSMGEKNNKCNPFSQRVYLHLSFKAWLKLMHQNKQGVINRKSQRLIYKPKISQTDNEIIDKEEEYEIIEIVEDDDGFDSDRSDILSNSLRELLPSNQQISVDKMDTSQITRKKQKRGKENQYMLHSVLKKTLEEVSEELSADFSMSSAKKRKHSPQVSIFSFQKMDKFTEGQKFSISPRIKTSNNVLASKCKVKEKISSDNVKYTKLGSSPRANNLEYEKFNQMRRQNRSSVDLSHQDSRLMLKNQESQIMNTDSDQDD